MAEKMISNAKTATQMMQYAITDALRENLLYRRRKRRPNTSQGAMDNKANSKKIKRPHPFLMIKQMYTYTI